MCIDSISIGKVPNTPPYIVLPIFPHLLVVLSMNVLVVKYEVVPNTIIIIIFSTNNIGQIKGFKAPIAIPNNNNAIPMLARWHIRYNISIL